MTALDSLLDVAADQAGKLAAEVDAVPDELARRHARAELIGLLHRTAYAAALSKSRESEFKASESQSRPKTRLDAENASESSTEPATDTWE